MQRENFLRSYRSGIYLFAFFGESIYVPDLPDKPDAANNYKPAHPKLDARTAISILRHRLLMAAAAIHDISEGRQPSTEELEELSEACADIFNILENVDAI